MKRYRDIFLQPFRRDRITALHNVSLQVKKGELFGLLGPNGAGKTTFIKILCTLILPTSGKAYVNGFEVTKKDREVRKSIGYVVCDERSFYWRLSGEQNLRFFAKLNNIPRREADKRIVLLLDFLELSHDARRLFKDYSTGMRQKLAIARGLLTDPEIVFMDEPFNGLDPVSALNLKKLIKGKLVESEGKTVVFTTHNLQDAEELCTRLAVIHNGGIKFTGKLEDVRKEFNRSKIYIIKLQEAGDGLLEKIRGIPAVKNIAPATESPFHGALEVEVEITGNNGSLSGIIKEIVDRGGELYSLYEKEPSLVEIFSRVINTE